MALPKDSPYYVFMRHFILQLMEKGPLIRLQDQFAEELNCGSNIQRAKVITLEKIFTLFVWLGMGFILALATLVLEIIKERSLNEEELKAAKLQCTLKHLQNSHKTLALLSNSPHFQDLVSPNVIYSIENTMMTLKNCENDINLPK